MSVSTPLVCHDCWPTRAHWHKPCPHAMEVYEQGKAAGAPPAGLTVAGLAALLREYPTFGPIEDDTASPTQRAADAHDTTMRRAQADALAAWLLPRLIAVGPGAPAAARIAPTDAMIAAAWRVVSRWEVRSAAAPRDGYMSVCDECDGYGEDEHPETIAHTPTCVIGVLRAALAAQGEL